MSGPAAPAFRAWKRKNGECAATHIGALVTEPPLGTSRDYEPAGAGDGGGAARDRGGAAGQGPARKRALDVATGSEE